MDIIKLDKFNSSDWSGLLQDQPQFAEKCDRWDEFCGTDWSELLRKQPQFAEKRK